MSGPMSWKPWTPQEARMAGQTELVAGRSTDPKLRAARAEKNAFRRSRRRRKRAGVFISIAETTAAPGGITPGVSKQEEAMDMSKFVGVPFMKGTDVTPLDVHYPGIITRVTREKVGQDKVEESVLYFTDKDGMECRITLNETNIHNLIRDFGKESDAWPGQLIDYWAEKTGYQGKPGIRVAKRGSRSQANPAADLNEDVPF